MEKLMIVDGNSLLFRAYYATAYGQMMKTSTGIPTNAVFAFTGMFLKALEIIEPDHVVVAFDAGKHTFRHDLYPEYKGGRKECPEELVPQFKLIRDMLDAWPIRWLELADIEADDIIGTLSRKFPDVETHILSSDHDLLQLIDDTTSVWMIRKGMKEIDQMTPAALKEQMGIEPLQIIELKGLMGDNSDNIPGIPGVGEKTALKLLADYHDVDNLLAHTDELKGKLKEKVENGRESALLSKTLATIKTDAPVDITLDECRFTTDHDALIRYFQSLEMNVYVRRFEALKRSAGSETVTEETTSDRKDMIKVDHIPDDFYKPEYVCLVDADEAHFMDATVYGLGLSNGKDSYYISIDDVKKDKNLCDHLAKDHLIGLDVKRAYHMARIAGLTLNYQDDAWLAAFLSDGTGSSFDKLIEKEGLTLNLTNEDVYGKADKPKMPDEAGQIQHMQEMADITYGLMGASLEKIREQDIEKLYRDIELPLSYTLFKMEEEGIRVDLKVLDEIAADTYKRLNNLSASIYELTGKEFNINSPKQLASVLFDDLGLPGGKKRSTNVEVLEKLVGMHPVIEVLMEYRKLQKIYSTYAEGLKKYVKPDGRIHTIYNQCLTATGRLSSSDPNLQNISVRDEEGKEIRKAFIADEGHILVSSDYSQIELRMLAHMAQEKGLIMAFTSGLDAHTKTAMDIFGVKADEVTGLMRRKAKAVNFGIVYGISDFGLAQQLGIFRNEAKEIIDLYFLTYPGIRTFMDETVRSCQEKGYVKTLLNRRRYIPEINDKNHMVKEFGKRAAMNAPIQGSAADLIKLAMLKIDAMMQEKNVRSRMILQVHDELIFNVCEDEIETMKQIIKEGMESAMELSVPLVQETNTGYTWYEAK